MGLSSKVQTLCCMLAIAVSVVACLQRANAGEEHSHEGDSELYVSTVVEDLFRIYGPTEDRDLTRESSRKHKLYSSSLWTRDLHEGKYWRATKNSWRPLSTTDFTASNRKEINQVSSQCRGEMRALTTSAVSESPLGRPVEGETNVLAVACFAKDGTLSGPFALLLTNKENIVGATVKGTFESDQLMTLQVKRQKDDRPSIDLKRSFDIQETSLFEGNIHVCNGKDSRTIKFEKGRNILENDDLFGTGQIGFPISPNRTSASNLLRMGQAQRVSSLFMIHSPQKGGDIKRFFVEAGRHPVDKKELDEAFANHNQLRKSCQDEGEKKRAWGSFENSESKGTSTIYYVCVTYQGKEITFVSLPKLAQSKDAFGWPIVEEFSYNLEEQPEKKFSQLDDIDFTFVPSEIKRFAPGSRNPYQVKRLRYLFGLRQDARENQYAGYDVKGACRPQEIIIQNFMKESKPVTQATLRDGLSTRTEILSQNFSLTGSKSGSTSSANRNQ